MNMLHASMQSVSMDTSTNSSSSSIADQAVPAQSTEHTKFGPIMRNSINSSPLMNDLSYLVPMVISPMNGGLFPYRLASPTTHTMQMHVNALNGPIFEPPKLPIIQPIAMVQSSNTSNIQVMNQGGGVQYNELTNWQQTVMNFHPNSNVNEGLKHLPSFDLPPDIKREKSEKSNLFELAQRNGSRKRKVYPLSNHQTNLLFSLSYVCILNVIQIKMEDQMMQIDDDQNRFVVVS